MYSIQKDLVEPTVSLETTEEVSRLGSGVVQSARRGGDGDRHNCRRE